MTELWTIAGALIGWISIEIPFALAQTKIPFTFNIAFAFVGGLTAYTIITNQ